MITLITINFVIILIFRNYFFRASYYYLVDTMSRLRQVVSSKWTFLLHMELLFVSE